jgi:hypothetical protein
MAKSSPEKLAAALRANLKRRKQAKDGIERLPGRPLATLRHPRKSPEKP